MPPRRPRTASCSRSSRSRCARRRGALRAAARVAARHHHRGGHPPGGPRALAGRLSPARARDAQYAGAGARRRFGALRSRRSKRRGEGAAPKPYSARSARRCGWSARSCSTRLPPSRAAAPPTCSTSSRRWSRLRGISGCRRRRRAGSPSRPFPARRGSRSPAAIPSTTLRERVTSKGGTTERALKSMEADRVKEAIVRRGAGRGGALARAGRRARQGLTVTRDEPSRHGSRHSRFGRHAHRRADLSRQHRVRSLHGGAAAALLHAVGARARAQPAVGIPERADRLDGAPGAPRHPRPVGPRPRDARAGMARSS